jgi:hypothetical protein
MVKKSRRVPAVWPTAATPGDVADFLPESRRRFLTWALYTFE